jgi:ribonuclease J
MNMMVLECGEDAVIIDCGQRMPEEDTPGVDLIVPDISHLEEIRERIRGILLTHGHEDHIGALPYLWPVIRAPIYGRRLTLALARDRLREVGLDREAELREVKVREEIPLGALRAKFVHVTHSIAQASALIITTPHGIIVHSGDYKMDDEPPDGEAFDAESLRQAGDQGVIALLADSTNVERPGHTVSESALRPTFERLLGDATGAVLVGCFASSTHRVRMVCEVAQSLGKRVILTGLSMTKNVKICRDLGILRTPDDLFADASEYRRLPADRRIVLASGTQGEALGALTRIALDEHRHISLGPGDSVILSARIIPGNERAIFRMVNHFFRRGVDVHFEPMELVHTSGHAQRDEMRRLIELVRPRCLIPIHGEMRHLIAHRRLGVEMGIPEENCFVVEDGNVIEITADGARRAGDVPAGRVFVDGLGVGDISEVVLRDRKHLAQDGMVVVILVVDRQTRELAAGPDLVTRGVVYVDESEDSIEEWRTVVRRAFQGLPRESREESTVIDEEIRRALRRAIKRRYDRRPMILPMVMEV